ncbi:hypothetical protein M5K25_010426 [Dendrobium thyrsiflorum]|uniref:Uncharacterized protein n=1 Tax=Dendrobium thyrsiflorum TaxID=117978 RepID=A0ABD0V0C5_DENTH
MTSGERMMKAFHWSIRGLLFISTEKTAFLSDRSFVFRTRKGNIAMNLYKRASVGATAREEEDDFLTELVEGIEGSSDV